MSLPPPPPVADQRTLPHCYRHPDREAGRSCTRCGRSACSECLVQAAVGSHCLECAKAARPDVATRAKYWNARQHTLVTYVLMAVNIVVFAVVSIADTSSLSGRSGISGLQCKLGLSRQVLETGGFCSATQLEGAHQWYRLVSSGFLHYGIIHIAFNMFMLYQLGQLLERRLGRAKFGLLYGASLLGGSLGVIIVNQPGLSGGASGAVFGLMAAAAVGLQRQGINVFSTGLGTTLLLNLFLTFTISGISIGGHLGGAAAGAICGFVMLAPHWKPVPKQLAWATPVAVAVLSVAASMVLSS